MEFITTIMVITRCVAPNAAALCISSGGINFHQVEWSMTALNPGKPWDMKMNVFKYLHFCIICNLLEPSFCPCSQFYACIIDGTGLVFIFYKIFKPY